MLRILHAADFHLDAPFAGLNPEQAKQRRSEQQLLLDKLADLAFDRKADLVLLAGDLFDPRQTSPDTIQALATALGRIPAPVLIAPGNHDFFHPNCLYASGIWPKNVHVFDKPDIRVIHLSNCVVYGSAFTNAFREHSPMEGFCVPKTETLPAIMVLHAEVADSSQYCPIRHREIAASGLDYLALGHLHTYSGLQKDGRTTWAYPGCLEGHNFDETGEKGILWVTLDDGNVQAEFLPLASRQYEVLTCDVTGHDPLEAMTDLLAHGSPADICRLILTGESETIFPAALEASAAPYRWALQIWDRTSVPQSVWSRSGEDSLRGLFLRDMHLRIATAQNDQEKYILERAVRYGLAALENGEDTP